MEGLVSDISTLAGKCAWELDRNKKTTSRTKANGVPNNKKRSKVKVKRKLEREARKSNDRRRTMRLAEQWIQNAGKRKHCERIAIETKRQDGWVIEYVNTKKIFVESVSKPRVVGV